MFGVVALALTLERLRRGGARAAEGGQNRAEEHVAQLEPFIESKMTHCAPGFTQRGNGGGKLIAPIPFLAT